MRKDKREKTLMWNLEMQRMQNHVCWRSLLIRHQRCHNCKSYYEQIKKAQRRTKQYSQRRRESIKKIKERWKSQEARMNYSSSSIQTYFNNQFTWYFQPTQALSVIMQFKTTKNTFQLLISQYLICQSNMEKSIFQYDSKWQTVNFMAPTKKIILFQDVAKFEKTKIYAQYIQFLTNLQKSIAGKSIDQTNPIQKFKVFDIFFQKLEQFLLQTPPIHQPMRYGNKAFKDWYQKAASYTNQFLDKIIPQKISGAKNQLYRYIVESFGSNVRIDYGSGHELSFMFFCWALQKLGFYKQEQNQQMVRQLFYKYVNTIRKVQIEYMLQPAGSHGVWGLDDYVFLPFLLGASQFLGNENLSSPQIIHNDSIVSKYSGAYMYLNCIKFIKEAKKNASFAQTSPVLNNISGAANWQKITGGMIKMYKAEVLGKHPVIKHQYFGTIIPYQ